MIMYSIWDQDDERHVVYDDGLWNHVDYPVLIADLDEAHDAVIDLNDHAGTERHVVRSWRLTEVTA